MNLPERCYDTPEMLPAITFDELRNDYFRNARSRSEIFDYEHCMLELQSLFQFVRTLSKSSKPDWYILNTRIGDAFKRIKALRKKLMLIA